MYEELIDSLKLCGDKDVTYCNGCLLDKSTNINCRLALMQKAADAIETLQEENRFLKNMQKQLASSVDKRELGNMVRGALNGAERT